MTLDTPYFTRTSKQAAESPERDSAKSDRDTDMNEAAEAITSLNASSPRSDMKRLRKSLDTQRIVLSDNEQEDKNEDKAENNELERQDKEVLAWAKKTGLLPCVIWRPRETEPTYCFKDLRTGRFRVSGGHEEMTASKLVRKYGPTGGKESRNDVAIKVVLSLDEEKRLPHPKDTGRHLKQGDWYEMYEKEMVDLEELFQREQEKEKSDPETVRKTEKSLEKLDKSTTKLPEKSTVDNPKKSDSKRRSRNESPQKKRVKEEKKVKEDKEPAHSLKEQRFGMSVSDFLKLKPEVQLAFIESERHVNELRAIAEAFRSR